MKRKVPTPAGFGFETFEISTKTIKAKETIERKDTAKTST